MQGFGICDFFLIHTYIPLYIVLEELVRSIFRVQVAKEERCTERVACYVRKGDWHSEVAGVEVCILGRFLTLMLLMWRIG
jgi:hypothetical protein